MKKLLLICLAILCSLLVGCSRENTSHKKYDAKVFDSDIEQRIYVDMETGVQYIYIDGYHRAGLSVRVDANGKPMTGPVK